MALPPNAQAVPTPTATVDPVEKKRQKDIAIRRRAEEKKMDAANTASKAKAKAKKGNQTVTYESIQGTPDFGIGQAGPGMPYSVKKTKLPEKAVFQKPKGKTPTSPPAGTLPDWATGKALWPVGNVSPMQATDWKLAAIRRRLGNG